MAAFGWGKGLVKGFFWGGLMGVVIGFLYSAKKDGGTWEDIGRSADALVDKAREQIGLASRKMEELADRRKDAVLGEKEDPKENEPLTI
jgi:hypothetical protein